VAIEMRNTNSGEHISAIGHADRTIRLPPPTPFNTPCILHNDPRSVLAAMAPPPRRIVVASPWSRRDNGYGNFPLIVSSFRTSFKSRKRTR
jgi:hypothetical protein